MTKAAAAGQSRLLAAEPRDVVEQLITDCSVAAT